MIVRDESHVIEKTLLNVTEKIKIEYYVISDTGSTDDTVEIIENFFRKKGISGEIYHDEWKDFSHNRNLALDHAKNKSEYILIFDADDEIQGEFPDIYNKLSADCYVLLFGREINCCYSRIAIIKNDAPIRYIGVLHELLHSDEKLSTSILQGNYNIISGKTGARNKDPDKYYKDALILEKAFYDCGSKPDFLKPRYLFYVGKSYYDARMFEKTIEWFKKLLETPCNCPQEKYLGCLMLFNSYCEIKQKETGLIFLLISHELDPNRVECIFNLIVYMYEKKLVQKAFLFYTLIQDFVENKLLDYKYDHIIFFNEQIHFVLLPLLMIEICTLLKKDDIVMKMFKIIFSKKFFINTQSTVMATLLYNTKFWLNSFDSCLRKLLFDYIQILKKTDYPLHNYSFLSEELNIPIPKLFDRQEAKKSKEILFATCANTFEWNYTYGLKHALGGSERAVNFLTQKFPKYYNLTVTGTVIEEKVNKVTYCKHIDVNKLYHSIIISRDVGILEKHPNLKFYQLFIWVHDIVVVNSSPSSYQPIFTVWLNRITKFVCLTEWHKNYLLEMLPFIPVDKIHVINNGINLDMFPSVRSKVPNTFLYPNCPERGLKRLIKDIWPELIRKIPDAKLRICNYNEFPRNKEEEFLNDIINTTESIEYLGKLNTDQLYQLMASTEYWLYPTDFLETSCITAMEMLASEVICIYYPVAGLVNTLGEYGIPIKEGEEIDVILTLTEEKKSNIRKKGLEYARTCDWESRVKEWNKLLGIW